MIEQVPVTTWSFVGFSKKITWLGLKKKKRHDHTAGESNLCLKSDLKDEAPALFTASDQVTFLCPGNTNHICTGCQGNDTDIINSVRWCHGFATRRDWSIILLSKHSHCRVAKLFPVLSSCEQPHGSWSAALMHACFCYSGIDVTVCVLHRKWRERWFEIEQPERPDWHTSTQIRF